MVFKITCSVLSPVIKVKLEKDCPVLLKPGGDLKSFRRCQCKKLKGTDFYRHIKWVLRLRPFQSRTVDKPQAALVGRDVNDQTEPFPFQFLLIYNSNL